MIYNDFQGISLSRLGFGMMRLPLCADGSIDEEAVFAMVDYALAHGVNYFDTAYPYHDGLSEIVAGKALSRHPRDSYYLADKYPGHQIADTYDPAGIFEEQLQKCGVEYFDFYLLHNINENSLPVYMDPKWGIVDYFVEQRKKGRIKHLGFSCHIQPENLKTFLDYCGSEMEFCQMQLNYLDWTLQSAKEKYEMLTAAGIPVWVMEPVRGGKLAQLPDAAEAKLKALRPDESMAAWSLRFLQALPNVKMVLSGMSNMAQMVDNVHTYEAEKPLNEKEYAALMGVAEELKDAVPCTACRYCCAGCPAGLDIPTLIQFYNNARVQKSITVSIQMSGFPADKWPDACVGCGQCAHACPQKIDVPQVMTDFAELMKTMPDWKAICAERAEAMTKLRKK